MPNRRFPSPWSIEEGSACFIVRDHDKQALAYVYYENESGRRSSAKTLRWPLICASSANNPRRAQFPGQVPHPPPVAHIGSEQVKVGNKVGVPAAASKSSSENFRANTSSSV